MISVLLAQFSASLFDASTYTFRFKPDLATFEEEKSLETLVRSFVRSYYCLRHLLPARIWVTVVPAFSCQNRTLFSVSLLPDIHHVANFDLFSPRGFHPLFPTDPSVTSLPRAYCAAELTRYQPYPAHPQSASSHHPCLYPRSPSPCLHSHHLRDPARDHRHVPCPPP